MLSSCLLSFRFISHFSCPLLLPPLISPSLLSSLHPSHISPHLYSHHLPVNPYFHHFLLTLHHFFHHLHFTSPLLLSLCFSRYHLNCHLSFCFLLFRLLSSLPSRSLLSPLLSSPLLLSCLLSSLLLYFCLSSPLQWSFIFLSTESPFVLPFHQCSQTPTECVCMCVYVWEGATAASALRQRGWGCSDGYYRQCEVQLVERREGEGETEREGERERTVAQDAEAYK